MATLYKLIYTSKAKSDVTDEMLEEILANARRNNGKNDITGILLYSNGQFVQALEGKRKTVMETFERIKANPLHTRCNIIFEEYQEERVFQSWRMAYLPINRELTRAMAGNLDVKSVDQLFEVLNQPSKIMQQFFQRMLRDIEKSARVRHSNRSEDSGSTSPRL